MHGHEGYWCLRLFSHSLILSIGRWYNLVQSLSHVQLFTTPWIAECQPSLSITNSWSLFKLMSIKSVMPSNHLKYNFRIINLSQNNKNPILISDLYFLTCSRFGHIYSGYKMAFFFSKLRKALKIRKKEIEYFPLMIWESGMDHWNQLIIREMRTTITIRYYLTLVKMVVIKKEMAKG